jgi:pimeloyl-ACP methyl ester carboxylesterase/DNA-binding winged helix-turn-helix (wHTH) protein
MKAFGPFRLDPSNEMLTRDGRPVKLRPKAFAMLSYLVASAGELVTKQHLLDDLWPDAFIGDAALKTCMREIRRALDDDAQHPSYIETAHRRGYRFIARVDAMDAAGGPGVPAPVESPFRPPQTRYARHGSANIAYQVIGDGPIDLVYSTGWVSHLEYMWEEPSFSSFLMRLASFARVILYDMRGAGLSDQLPDAPGPDLRADDLRAVLDAVGSREAVLVGASDGGAVCSLFAALYPERTRALVTIGSYAKGTASSDYPWGRSPRDFESLLDRIRREWGGPDGVVAVDDLAPTCAHDARFRKWWSRYLRNGATPAAALTLARMNGDTDVREVLPVIGVPSLLLHRTGDRMAPVEGARYMAACIPSARLVELPGTDHLPFVGDQDAIVNEIERFVRPLQSDEPQGGEAAFHAASPCSSPPWFGAASRVASCR